MSEVNMFVCPECSTRCNKAKRSTLGLIRSCPSNCGFWLLHQKKWYSHELEY